MFYTSLITTCVLMDIYLNSRGSRKIEDLAPPSSPHGVTTNKDAITPVRISRKDLRRMSNEEVTLRKSAASQMELAGQLLYSSPLTLLTQQASLK